MEGFTVERHGQIYSSRSSFGILGVKWPVRIHSAREQGGDESGVEVRGQAGV